MMSELDIFNPELLMDGEPYLNWVNQVDDLLIKRYGQTVHFKQWALNGDKLEVQGNG